MAHYVYLIGCSTSDILWAMSVTPKYIFSLTSHPEIVLVRPAMTVCHTALRSWLGQREFLYLPLSHLLKVLSQGGAYVEGGGGHISPSLSTVLVRRDGNYSQP